MNPYSSGKGRWLRSSAGWIRRGDPFGDVPGKEGDSVRQDNTLFGPKCCWFALAVVLMAGCFFLLMPGDAGAGVYKFVDSQGVTRYTDDLLLVPVDQRPPVVEETETQLSAAVESNPATTAVQETTIESTTDEDEKRSDVKNRGAGLTARRERLDAEYSAIMREQQRLSSLRDGLRSARERKEYHLAVTQLNARIQAYEQRRRNLAVQVTEYNENLQKFNEKRKALESEIKTYTGSGG